MRITNYVRPNKIHVYKKGNDKIFEFCKRPHGGYCCFVFNKGKVVAGEGFFCTALPFKYNCVKWAIEKCRELGII